MSDSIYTTTSAKNVSVNPSPPDQSESSTDSGDQVAVFRFNSTKFMVSPHPDEGNAVTVAMQGQSMAIQVATVYFASTTLIAETVWETPFCGRPPEWKSTLLDLVLEHCQPTSVGVEQ